MWCVSYLFKWGTLVLYSHSVVEHCKAIFSFSSLFERKAGHFEGKNSNGGTRCTVVLKIVLRCNMYGVTNCGHQMRPSSKGVFGCFWSVYHKLWQWQARVCFTQIICGIFIEKMHVQESLQECDGVKPLHQSSFFHFNAAADSENPSTAKVSSQD